LPGHLQNLLSVGVVSVELEVRDEVTLGNEPS
jgi:hypothetical protein